MADKEEKGFTVTDRRSVAAGDTGTEAAAAPPQETEGDQPKSVPGDGEGHHTGRSQGMAEEAVADGQRAARSAASMPEIDFGTFVMSLASSVLVHLGELSPPGQPVGRANFPLAKQTIDILGMLQDKTRGNLSDDEARLLEHLLYDLRLKYVDVKKRGS